MYRNSTSPTTIPAICSFESFLVLFWEQIALGIRQKAHLSLLLGSDQPGPNSLAIVLLRMSIES